MSLLQLRATYLCLEGLLILRISTMISMCLMLLADRDESSPYAAMLAAQDVAQRCKIVFCFKAGREEEEEKVKDRRYTKQWRRHHHHPLPSSSSSRSSSLPSQSSPLVLAKPSSSPPIPSQSPQKTLTSNPNPICPQLDSSPSSQSAVSTPALSSSIAITDSSLPPPPRSLIRSKRIVLKYPSQRTGPETSSASWRLSCSASDAAP
ncbi:hypothetical protein Bca52824_024134 [Brassica carinata]|uniref:Uncharacterized protein n=1 Tax=Brassica carinata TaxID=52824 RepID=A0A8X8AVA0_BRACI|nr:hypothetical protein Bca52824_024134 [Brassica carinata]